MTACVLTMEVEQGFINVFMSCSHVEKGGKDVENVKDRLILVLKDAGDV